MNVMLTPIVPNGEDADMREMPELKSRRWRDGEWNSIYSAANDSVFKIGRSV